MKRVTLKKKPVPASLNVFQVNPKTLKLHPDNVRVHDERNIQAIMTSLQEYGQQKPIVINSAKQVLAGNGTLEAIRRLGWQQVAVVRSSLSAIKAMGFMVADNKTTDLSDFDYSKLSEVMLSLQEKEFNLDATGFNEYERHPLLVTETKEKEDLPSLAELFHAKQSEIAYQDDDCVLWHGNCLQIMKSIEESSIDMIWTDPPYGIKSNDDKALSMKREAALGQRRTTEEDNRSIASDDIEQMQSTVGGMLTQAVRVLKQDCCICCCCAGGGPIPVFAWMANRLDQDGLKFFQAVVWDKGGLGLGWRYRCNYEFVMVSHKDGGKLKWEHDGHGKETANVVSIPKLQHLEKGHPTPKPEALTTHFLKLHAKPGDVLLDPFCGAGTTLVAGLKAGLKVIGIEIDKRWLDMAKERIQDVQSKRGVHRRRIPRRKKKVILRTHA